MMEPWVSKILWCVGLLALAYAMSQSSFFWLRRLGLWVVFGTVGLGIWFVSENGVLVLAGFLGWFGLPLAQALYFSRNLRFSLSRSLVKERLNVDDLEEWVTITQEFRKEGFSTAGEYCLKPSFVDYGFRLFQRSEQTSQRVGGIGLVRQGAISLYYIVFVTKAKDGTLWMTWDYPLAYGLKMPPQIQAFRCLESESVNELLAQHEAFLKLNDVVEAEDNSEPQALFNRLFCETMSYNLSIGLLKLANASQEEILYSWRGTFFIIGQVLRQMVKGY